MGGGFKMEEEYQTELWDDSIPFSELSPKYAITVGDGLRIMLSLLNKTDESNSEHGKRYVFTSHKELKTKFYGLEYDQLGNLVETDLPIDEETGERMSELYRGKPYTVEEEVIYQRYFSNHPEYIDTFIETHPIISKYITERNMYYTPNLFRFFSKGRLEANVSHLTGIFIDIDNVSIEEAQSRLDASGLPTPTVGIFSGGGVHYYWIFNYNVPANEAKTKRAKELGYTYLDTWRNLTRYYQYKLGGDPKVSDASRLLRIPGSINYNHEEPLETFFLFVNEDITYNILDLNRQYLEERDTLVQAVNSYNLPLNELYKPFRYLVDSKIHNQGDKLIEQFKEIGPNSKVEEPKPFVRYNNIRYGFANYHHLVIQDLIKLSELRGGITKGNRNDFLLLLHQFGMTKEELYLANLNYIRPCDRYTTKQVDYILNRKHNYTKDGAKPKRETMIEWLKITIDEQSQLKVIVSEPLANIRKAINRIDETSSKIFNGYEMLLKRVVANHIKGKKWTVKYKAELLNLTTRGVYRLQKDEVRTLAQEQQEQERIITLVKSSLDLIDEVLNTLFALIDMGLPQSECTEFQNRLDKQTKQLNKLNSYLSGEPIFHKSKVRVKQVESRVIELKDYLNTLAA